MKRRSFLAALGAVSLGGCLGRNTRTSDDQVPATPSPNPTATPTPTLATPETVPTVDEPDRWLQHIESADETLPTTVSDPGIEVYALDGTEVICLTTVAVSDELRFTDDTGGKGTLVTVTDLLILVGVYGFGDQPPADTWSVETATTQTGPMLTDAQKLHSPVLDGEPWGYNHDERAADETVDADYYSGTLVFQTSNAALDGHLLLRLEDAFAVRLEGVETFAEHRSP